MAAGFRNTPLRVLLTPAALFTIVSLLTGLAAIAVTPPLRGPDENAHFLRAYGLARGDIVPRTADAQGRKGVLLPQRIAAGFMLFERAREQAGEEHWDYSGTFAAHARLAPGRGGDVFVPYGGSEAYAPVAYLPYVAAAAVAELVRFEFLPMLYLMRVFGLVAMTALVAYAIARTPALPWAFFAVAMLPSALLGRATVSADGAVLALTLIVIALCLRAAARLNSGALERGIWMTLCVLTKPSQVALPLVELMAGRPRRAVAAAVMLPGIVLTVLWMLLAGTDIGTWRLSEGGSVSTEQFRVGWKLRYMLAHPLQFPAALITSLDYSAELWRQLIGVLGWLDTPLHPLAYPVLTVLLIAASLDRLDLPRAVRLRIAAVAGATALIYCVVVFALLYVTWTPAGSERVLGVQGRYFIVAVPLLALAAAAFNPWRPPSSLQASAAIALSVVSAAAMVDAVIRMDWR